MGLSIEHLELRSAINIQETLDAPENGFDFEWITAPFAEGWEVDLNQDFWYDIKDIESDLVRLVACRVKGEVEVWHSDGWFVKYLLRRDELGGLIQMYHGKVVYTQEPDVLRGITGTLA